MCMVPRLMRGAAAQVNQLYIAPDVVEDYDSGLEYGTAARVLRMVQRGDEREFLVQCAPLLQGCITLGYVYCMVFTGCGAIPLLAALMYCSMMGPCGNSGSCCGA